MRSFKPIVRLRSYGIRKQPSVFSFDYGVALASAFFQPGTI
jgi:hypothetical protein